MDERDIVDQLSVKAAMISMGEKIAWGSEVNLMHDAAVEITRLRAEVERMRETARVFEDHYERGICHHEGTHRGGSIWTICDECGQKWADDEGGFKPFEYPPEIVACRAALEQDGG